MLSLLASSSNLTVCVAFYKNEKLRSALSLLIVSLAVADLFTGLIVIPSYCVFVYERNFYDLSLGYYFYAVYICFDIFFGIASIYNMTLMSIERALVLAAPNFHRKTLAKTSLMKRLLVLPWLLAILLTIPKIIHYTHKIDSRLASIAYFVLAFVLPFLIIAVCYGYVFKTRLSFVRQQTEYTKKDLRLAYTVLAIVVIFFICWTPFFSILLYYALCTKCSQLNNAVILVKWLQFLHSCCNPFIYAVLQPRFRQELKMMIKRCLKKQNKTSQDGGELEQQPMSECTNL